MGKLKVYESGKIKIEIGGFLYDLNEGIPINMYNDLVSI